MSKQEYRTEIGRFDDLEIPVIEAVPSFEGSIDGDFNLKAAGESTKTILNYSLDKSNSDLIAESTYISISISGY